MTAMSVEARIERLERENRRLKLVGTVLLIIAAAFVLMGQTADAHVRSIMMAERFALATEDGQVGAQLAYDKNGNPGFVLYDANQVPRAFMNFTADGTPGIELRNASNITQVVLGFDGKQDPIVALHDSTGQARAVVALDNAEYPAFELIDADGTRRSVYHFDGNRNPVLDMRSPEGTRLIDMGFDDANRPEFRMAAPRNPGQIRYRTGFDGDDDWVGVVLYSQAGRVDAHLP